MSMSGTLIFINDIDCYTGTKSLIYFHIQENHGGLGVKSRMFVRVL